MARVRSIALALLALAPACGASSLGKPGPSKDGGMDGGPDAATSLWEEVVAPVSDIYQSIALGPPGTIYVTVQGNPYIDHGTAYYSIASSHDDGATWTTVPLTTVQTQPILSVVAIGATDVYGVGFSSPYPSTPLVARSTDSGASFTLLHPSFMGSLVAAGADGSGNPVAAGATPEGHGLFARSTDGGTTWTTVIVPGTSILHALWTDASGNIYACGAPPAPPTGGTDAGADAGRPDGGTDAGTSDAGPAPNGVVVRSADNGNTWTTLTTTPDVLLAISGVPDFGYQRIMAVGAGYTQVQSEDSGATWTVFNGAYGGGYGTHTFSSFTGVWIPPGDSAITAPYIAASGAPYVLTGPASTLGGIFVNGYQEYLPTPRLGLQSSAAALAGTADGTELWAAGAGIFRLK